MANDLSGRQRLELAMLCDDFERAGSDPTPALTALVRYVHRERIGPEDFTEHDHMALIHAHTAAVMVADASFFTPDSTGFEILMAVGVLTEVRF